MSPVSSVRFSPTHEGVSHLNSVVNHYSCRSKGLVIPRAAEVCSVPKEKTSYELMQTYFIGVTVLIFCNFVLMEIYDNIELRDR
jgi:hypothetical protein